MRALTVLGLVLLVGVTMAAALPVPGSDGRLEVGGYVDGLAVVDTGGGQRQRPQALGVLRLVARPLAGLRGRLELRTRAGGPYEGGHPGVFNFVHTFQNYTPSLEVNEAYVDLELPRTDVRIGIQKFSWGRLDGFPPTDVVTPRDWHDPFVGELEETKVGVPALLATHYVPWRAIDELRLSFVWVPVAMPSRLALLEERWFPASIGSRTRIVFPRRRVELALERVLEADVIVTEDLVIPGRLRTVNQRPPLQLDEGGFGGRLAGTWRGMDFAVSHFSGPEAGPNLDLRTLLVNNGPTPDPDDLSLDMVSDTQLRQAHDIVHTTGADWATTIGPATLRAEAAFAQDRPLLRVSGDLYSRSAFQQLPLATISRALFDPGRAVVPLGDLFPDVDTFEWGLGADYLFAGVLGLLQVSQVVLLESSPRLLIADPETRVLTWLRRSFLADRLELEVRGVYAVERGGWFAFPRASWQLLDDLRVRVGYLAVGGSKNSVFGQFGRNDEVVFQVRQSF